MHSNDPHKNLASALGRIPSGIFILSVSQSFSPLPTGGEGPGVRGSVETGMLASWVQQCSFKPPMISFAAQRGRAITDLLSSGAIFTINILEASQTDMIAHFGKGFALGEPAFTDLDIQRDPPHGPILQEALAYLHAKVIHRVSAGDHDVFFAEVLAGAVLDDGQPMVHIRKNGLHY